jgi:ribosomal-protein-alanine N-acetyltransferase
MSWRVVAMTVDHLSEVESIERVSYHRPWSAEGLRHEVVANPVGMARVAVDGDGAVAGYLFGWDLGEEIRINNIAVAPARRRRGVARSLLGSLGREVAERGAARVTLEVRVGNTAARALYRSLGFEEAGLRPRHYEPEGEDAILLERRLDR